MEDVASVTSSSSTPRTSPAPSVFEAPSTNPFLAAPSRPSRATTLRPLPIVVPSPSNFFAREAHSRTIDSTDLSEGRAGGASDVASTLPLPQEDAEIRLKVAITPSHPAEGEEEAVDSPVGELAGLLGGRVDPGARDYQWETSTELQEVEVQARLDHVEGEDLSDDEWEDSREVPGTPATLTGGRRESGVEGEESRHGGGLDRGHVDDAEVMSENFLPSSNGLGSYRRIEGETTDTLRPASLDTLSNNPYTIQTQIPSDVSLPYPHDIDPTTGQRFDYIPPTPSPSAPAFHSRSSSSSSLNLPPDPTESRQDLNSRPNLARLASEETKGAPVKTPVSFFLPSEMINNGTQQKIVQGRSARKFFSKLLANKADDSQSVFTSTSQLSTLNPIPPLQYHTRASPSSSSPHRGSMLFGGRSHGRSESLPSPGVNTTDAVFGPLDNAGRSSEVSGSRSRTFPPVPHSPLLRSSSLQSMPRLSTPLPGSTSTTPRIPHSSTLPKVSSNPTLHSRTPTTIPTKLPGPKVTTLEDIGVSLFGLTLPISNSQPLCGALLDNYILIGMPYLPQRA